MSSHVSCLGTLDMGLACPLLAVYSREGTSDAARRLLSLRGACLMHATTLAIAANVVSYLSRGFLPFRRPNPSMRAVSAARRIPTCRGR